MKTHWQKLLPLLIGKALSLAGLMAPKKTVQASMQIFAKPRKGRVLTYQEKFLNKASAEVVTSNGQEYHIHVFGEAGMPVLLAHGWESNSWRWRKLMRYLGNEKFRYIAIDAPGHGKTNSTYFNVSEYAAAIAATVSRYGCTHIIGHSIGGFCCLYAAAQHPEAGIKKVISLAAPSSLRLIMEKYFSIIGLSRHMQVKTFNLFPELYGIHIDDLDIKNFGAQIQAAGLIVHDNGDNINGPESAHIIAKHWPAAQLFLTDFSDHSLQHETVFAKVVEHLLS
ncbi:MAG: alpha/beta hydrolase [Saprospiraceae bacterium]|nr:alpha/beta hydrolase [Saprospiraceae bacterium]